MFAPARYEVRIHEVPQRLPLARQHDKVMPYGMVSILISIVVRRRSHARIYHAGGGIASGVCLGTLIGIFSVCTFVIHNYVNLISPYTHALPERRLLHPVGNRRGSHRPHLQAILANCLDHWLIGSNLLANCVNSW